jgi:glutathione S-transferase
LIPADVQGRSRVVQWCFAALNTVERPLMEIQLIDKFGSAGDAEKRRAEMVKEAKRWFDGLESPLEGRDWIACADFTIADILLATVLRDIRKTDLLAPYPRLTAYYARALARPAWRHTLSLYAKRLGVEIADIQ